MNALAPYIHQYGYIVIFGASLLEQSGLPLPATPVYIAAGVAAGMGDLKLTTAVGLALAGSLIGDLFWYFLGLWRGHEVLKFLCRVSLEPYSCVRDTEERFLRRGAGILLVAKFIPGFSVLVRPLAAIAGVGLTPFLGYVGVGTLLYVGLFFGIGYLFSDQADQLARVLARAGHTLFEILLVIAFTYVVYKFYKRRQYLQKMATARVSASELKQRMDKGIPLSLVDLRTPLQIKAFPFSIPGALRIPLQEIEAAYTTIPADRDIILFCDCPNEVSSAKAALFLQKKGYASARPLTGGIEDWKRRTYPLEALS